MTTARKVDIAAAICGALLGIGIAYKLLNVLIYVALKGIGL